MWSETGAALESWDSLIEETLRGSGAVVMRGGDYDRWDLEVRGGLLGRGHRMLTRSRSTAAGRQLRSLPLAASAGLGSTSRSPPSSPSLAVDGRARRAPRRRRWRCSGLVLALVPARMWATAPVQPGCVRGGRLDALGNGRRLSDAQRPAGGTSSRRLNPDGVRSYTDSHGLARRLAGETRPYWLHIGGLLLLSLLATPLALLIAGARWRSTVDTRHRLQPLPGFLDAIAPGRVTGLGGRACCSLAARNVRTRSPCWSQLQELVSSLSCAPTRGERLVLDFRAACSAHVQRLSLSYHDARGTSDSTYRIQYDAPAIQYIVIDGVIPPS